MSLGELFTKVRVIFGDLAVNKGLAVKQEYSMLPRYVVEHLVSKFIDEYGEEKYARKLSEYVLKYYREARERDKILNDLIDYGTIKIIDEVKVETDIKLGMHRTHLMNLGVRNLMIKKEVVSKYEPLLITGMWGLAKLEYTPETVPRDFKGDPLLKPITLTSFEPFQCSYTETDIFKQARGHFTLDEWLDLLVNTMGLNHNRYSKRQKLLLISRLIPLVENNVNVMEFGPRATGKTYIYRNISPYTRIFAGGNISPAVLFYNIARRSLGEIAVKDVVVFDEISKVKFTNPNEMVGKLKDYMESGHYERGPKRAFSTCSLVFMGNISVERGETGEYVPVEEFTYVLPKDIRESAFIDRVHGVIPGWELPKIFKSLYHLSTGYGIATDYFAEVLHSLRRENYTHIIEEEAEFVGDYTIRDERAVKKISSVLLKLLVPDAPFSGFDRKELNIIMDLAIDFRNRVNDWLHVLAPGEFPTKRLKYKVG